MYISPLQYIELTDRIETLKKQCAGSHSQNVKLKQKIATQEQQIIFLQNRMEEMEKKQDQNHQKVIEHVTQTSGSIKDSIGMTAEEQRKFIQEQVQKLRNDVNVKKVQQIQKKMTQNRMKNHQMVDFYQKVKTLYHSWTKKKKQPTTTELYKWVSDRKIDVADNNSNQSIITTQKSFFSKMNGSKMMNSTNQSRVRNSRGKENGKNNTNRVMRNPQKKSIPFQIIEEAKNETEQSKYDMASQIIEGSLLQKANQTLKDGSAGDILKMDEENFAEYEEEVKKAMEESKFQQIIV